MWRLHVLVIFIFGISLIVLSYTYLVLRFFIGFFIVLPVLILISATTGFKYTNCWIFVAKKYIVKGGYVIFRRTKWNKYKWFNWEHAFWTPDLKTFYSVVPKVPKRERVIPPLLFKYKTIKVYEEVLCM